MELAVDVSHDGHGAPYMDHIALLHQQLFRLRAYCFDDEFIEEFLLVQLLDALIEVDGGYSHNYESAFIPHHFSEKPLRDVKYLRTWKSWHGALSLSRLVALWKVMYKAVGSQRGAETYALVSLSSSLREHSTCHQQRIVSNRLWTVWSLEGSLTARCKCHSRGHFLIGCGQRCSPRRGAARLRCGVKVNKSICEAKQGSDTTL